jgi:hypothetical protein
MAYQKDPNEKKDYTLDWSRHLGDEGDTISDSAWVVQSGLTESAAPAPSNTATTATIWLEDGTAGVEYRVTNTVTTVQGRIFERSIFVEVTEL